MRAQELVGVAFALALVACEGRDFHGSHSGRAQGNLVDGATRTSLASPSEVVEVERDGDTYVVTVRGCVLRGERRGDGLVVFDHQPCDFNVAGEGPARFTMHGQMTSVTKAPLHRILRATVSLTGEDASKIPPRRMSYLVEPVYDPSGAP